MLITGAWALSELDVSVVVDTFSKQKKGDTTASWRVKKARIGMERRDVT